VSEWHLRGQSHPQLAAKGWLLDPPTYLMCVFECVCDTVRHFVYTVYFSISLSRSFSLARARARSRFLALSLSLHPCAFIRAHVYMCIHTYMRIHVSARTHALVGFIHT
jgi:hypothetical protein